MRKYLYPFGHRPATFICMEQGLRNYADVHDGFFPDSDRGALDALQKLYPQYVDAYLLAGITGDPNATETAIKLGKPLNKAMTSWVYFPGINQNDSADLAILYESRKGILPNGRRSSTLGHVVLFNSYPSIRAIPDSEWDKFLLEQESLRKSTVSSREK
jgi:hypothetical protein